MSRYWGIVGWCDWLVTQNSRYWYHKIGNISCLSHFIRQFMLKWGLYQHICLPAFVWFVVSYLLQTLKICVYHLTPNSHAEVSEITVKWRCYWEGKPKYCWSDSRAFTVRLQAQNGAKIEYAIMQSVMLCDRCVFIIRCVTLKKVLTVTLVFTFLLQQYTKSYTLIQVHS